MNRQNSRKRVVTLVLTGCLCSLPAPAASVVEFTRTHLVLNELDASGGSPLPVVVSVTPPHPGPAQITVTLANGSARPGDDFRLSPWGPRDLQGAGGVLARLWFEPEMATREFQIVPVDDGLPEADEILILGLTNLPPGTVLGPRSNLVITIQNAAAQVGFSVWSGSLFSEGDEASIEVQRLGDTNAAFSVELAVSLHAASLGAATEGEDFLAPEQTVLEFGPGERLQYIGIPTRDDGLLDTAVRERAWLELSARSPGVGLGRAETWFDILDRQYSTVLDLGYSPPAGFYPWVAPARAPDGTVLVATVAADGWTNRLILLNPDGSVRQELPSQFRQVFALAWQADGKFLVASQAGIWRHHADGALDGHFASPTNLDFNGDVTLLPTSSGGVYVASPGAYRLTRLRPDGRKDPEFPDLELPATPSHFTLDHEDRLLVLGTPDEGVGFLVSTNYLVRWLADGTRDDSFVPRFEFGEAGRWWGPAPGELVVLPDGKLLVAGRFTAVNGVRRPYLARLNEDGTLDERFHYRAEMPWVNSILPMPDGTLVAAGFYLGAQRIGPDGVVLHSAPVGFVEGQCIWPWVTILGATDTRVLLGGSFYYVNGGMDRPHLAMERPHLVQVRMQGAPRTAAVFRQQQIETIERDAPVHVEVLRLGDVNARARVHYRTQDGTARAGEDFAGLDGTIEFELFEEVREWRDDYRWRVHVPAQPSAPARFFRILSPGRALRAAVRPKC